MHKKANRVPKSNFSAFISSIYPQTLTVLNSLLLPLCIAFIYIFFDFMGIAMTNIVMAKDAFAPIFDHLMVTLTIILCGSALIDVTLRETE